MMLVQDSAGTAVEAPRISDLLMAFRLDLPAGRVSLGDLVAVLGDRAFGGFLLVLSLPNILPLPLGVTTILDIPLLLIAGQLMLGRRTLWLPDFLLRRSLETDRAARLLDRIVALLIRTEGWFRPRLLFLSSPFSERLIGALCIFLGLVLMLPVPFLGWFPAFALVAVSFGLVERDGAVLLLGYGLSILAAFAAGAVVVGVAVAGDAWLEPFLDDFDLFGSP